MAHVSGSISLDMGRVERGVSTTVLEELLRRPKPDDDEATPLERIATAVTVEATRAIMPALADLGAALTPALADIGGALHGIAERLDRLESLVKAEAERGNRLALGLSGTGEFPTVALTPEDVTS